MVSYRTRVKIGSGVSLSLSVVQFRVPGQACGQGVAGVAGVPLFFELKNGAGRARGGPTIGARPRGMEGGGWGDFSSGLFVDLCPSGVFY